jgi:hypothetical protein
MTVIHPIASRFRRSSPPFVVVCLMGWLGSLGCESRASQTTPPPLAETTTASDATVAPSTALDGTSPAPAVPEWARGVWTGSGAAQVTTLQLPGNQGVQLAWLKDKGTAHVGDVRLRVEITASGDISGKLDGALGELDARGVWHEGTLDVQLLPAADGPQMFHGTATLELDSAQKTGRGSLRATTGDGQTLRSANLEVSKGPD